MQPPPTPPYLVKNFILTIKAEWMLDKTTLELTRDSMDSLKAFQESDGQLSVVNILQDYVTNHGGDIYSVPLFTEEFCSTMLDEIENMKAQFSFAPNEGEDELRQIPEIVLHEKCPELFNSMLGVVFNVMNPIFMSIWQRYSNAAASIQIANYNIQDKKQGAWHHDQTADISVVVPLNTGNYTGGGTEFHNRTTVEPLPNGHALFFPSFTHMHRGLPVEEDGDRYLLVFWLYGGGNET
tara:strand:- start:1841 stop:2554 length:714 start_codon:yes stop_codon:yes gene_type:complete